MPDICPCGSRVFHSACFAADAELISATFALERAKARAFDVYQMARQKERGDWLLTDAEARAIERSSGVA